VFWLGGGRAPRQRSPPAVRRPSSCAAGRRDPFRTAPGLPLAAPPPPSPPSLAPPQVNSYLEFKDEMLPRIRRAGYNAIQIMAIQEHA
jgi:hypothetical protein